MFGEKKALKVKIIWTVQDNGQIIGNYRKILSTTVLLAGYTEVESGLNIKRYCPRYLSLLTALESESPSIFKLINYISENVKIIYYGTDLGVIYDTIFQKKSL